MTNAKIEEVRIPTYPKIFAMGHRGIEELFNGPVVVEEKVDGSQFSFMKTEAGSMVFRSKGAMLNPFQPEKMFTLGVDEINKIAAFLVPGWVYYGEYLNKPKHNSLEYERVPTHNVILFDVCTDAQQQRFLDPEQKAREAFRIGLECVPVLFHGEIDSAEQLMALLQRPSVLGGPVNVPQPMIEGFVVKNYVTFNVEKKVAMGKFVSEQFKETHKVEWKKSNPTRKDFIQELIDALRTEARWDKAVQHKREAGELEGSPRDIGKLISEIPEDILAEEEDWIKESLFKHFWPDIRRGAIAGVAEWYKEKLMKEAFE